MIYNKKFDGDDHFLGQGGFKDQDKDKEDEFMSLLRKVESHRTFLETPKKQLSESIPNTARIKKEINENSFYEQDINTKKALDEITKDNRSDKDLTFELDVVEINEDNCYDLEKIFDK